MYRRNFTFGLASPTAAQAGGAWVLNGGGPTSFQYSSATTSTLQTTDMTAIACALNIFDQDEVYRQNFNGFCMTGTYIDGMGWGNTRPQVKRCIIDFGPPSTGSQKRAVGEYNGWPVFGKCPPSRLYGGSLLIDTSGIKIIDDEESVVDIPEQDMPELTMPAELISKDDVVDVQPDVNFR